MSLLKTSLVATTIVALATASHAGGLADEIMEAPVVVEEPVMAPAASSISPTWVVLGVLAALLIAANLEDDEEEQNGRVLIGQPIDTLQTTDR